MKVVENPLLLKSPKYWDDLGMALGTTGYFEGATNLDAWGKTSEALDLINQDPEGVSRRNVIMATQSRVWQINKHPKRSLIREKARDIKRRALLNTGLFFLA